MITDRMDRNIRSAVKRGNAFPATIVDVMGDRASARLSGNGAILKNLRVVGGPAYIGQEVNVDYTTPEPTIVAAGTGTGSVTIYSAGEASKLQSGPADTGVPASRKIIAGAGLVGGGTLATDVTIDVAASDASMAIDIDGIRVGLSALSGLIVAEDGLALNTPGTLDAFTLNEVLAASHTHQVNSYADASISGQEGHLLKSDALGGLKLKKLILSGSSEQLRVEYDAGNYLSLLVDSSGGATWSTTTSGAGGLLTLAPAGNIIVDPATNEILPKNNYDVSLGSPTKKFLTLHVAEAWYDILVANELVSTIGGRVNVAPTTELMADLPASSGYKTIQLVSSSTTEVNASSATVTKPSGLAAGDVLLALVSARGDSQTCSSSGFTLFQQNRSSIPSFPSDITAFALYKVAGSSEPSSYIFTFGVSARIQVLLLALRNVETNAVIDSQIGQGNPSQAALQAGELVADTPNAFIVYFSALQGASSYSLTEPEGFTGEIVDWSSVGTSGASHHFAYKVQAEAGSAGIIQGFSSTAAYNATMAISIKPAPLSVPTKIYTKHNQPRPGDILYMFEVNKLEAIKIVSGPTKVTLDGKTAYEYDTQRNLDGTGYNDWPAGTALQNTGVQGNGIIDLYAMSSIFGTPPEHVYNCTPAGVFSDNHNGDSTWQIFGDGANALGGMVYFGVENTTWEDLFYSIVTAAVYTATIVWEYWNGSTWAAFTPTTNTDFKSIGLKETLWSASSLTGWGKTAINGVSAYWVRARISAFTSWTTLPGNGGRPVYRYKRQYGPTIAGMVRETSTWNDIRIRWAAGNLSGWYDYAGEVYGFAAGKETSTWISADDSWGFRVMNGTTRLAIWDTAGNITIGKTDQAHVYISASSVKLKNSSVDIITLLSAADSQDRVATINGVLGITASGGFWMGSSGKFSAPGTGLKMWFDGTIGRMATYSGGSVQVQFDTSGRLIAGPVTLDKDGVRIKTIDSPAYNAFQSYGFVSTTGVAFGALYGIQTGNIRGLALVSAEAGRDNDIACFVTSDVNHYGEFSISATGFGRTARIELDADSSSARITYTADNHKFNNTVEAANFRYNGYLNSYKASGHHVVYAYQPLPSPLTSTYYDGDAYATGEHSINLISRFSLPAEAKAVLIQVTAYWNSAGNGHRLALRPSVGGTNAVVIRSNTAGVANDAIAVLPLASTTIGMLVEGSTANGVVIRIWGYFI